jgi:hypothetical protein
MPKIQPVIARIEVYNLLVYYFRLVNSLLTIALEQLYLADHLITSALVSIDLSADNTFDDFMDSRKILRNISLNLNSLEFQTRQAIDAFKTKSATKY